MAAVKSVANQNTLKVWSRGITRDLYSEGYMRLIGSILSFVKKKEVYVITALSVCLPSPPLDI
jgi:hypothetical protein